MFHTHGAHLLHVQEHLHHAEYRSQESQHRSSTRDGGQGTEVLLQVVNLQLADVLDGNADVLQVFADAADALVQHAGHGGIGRLAEVSSAVKTALPDVIPDFVHEIRADLFGLGDGHGAFKKQVDGGYTHQREQDHDGPAANAAGPLQNQFQDAHIHLLDGLTRFFRNLPSGGYIE